MSDYADQDDDTDYGDYVPRHACKACDTPAEDCGNTAAGAGRTMIRSFAIPSRRFM